VLRDQLGRQRVIEIAGLHASVLTRVRVPEQAALESPKPLLAGHSAR